MADAKRAPTNRARSSSKKVTQPPQKSDPPWIGFVRSVVDIATTPMWWALERFPRPEVLKPLLPPRRSEYPAANPGARGGHPALCGLSPSATARSDAARAQSGCLKYPQFCHLSSPGRTLQADQCRIESPVPAGDPVAPEPTASPVQGQSRKGDRREGAVVVTRDLHPPRGHRDEAHPVRKRRGSS